jgi:hypothetical protein
MYHKEMGWQGVDQVHQAKDGGQWWALVNMVMNFQVHKRWNFMTS